jgi:toxin ParE1/3/4
MKVVYSRRAERDLEAIDDYTLDVWGEAQRVRYMAALRECCEAVLPRLEHPQEMTERPGLFRQACGRHHVYFRRRGQALRIVRILHEIMLPERHL